MLLCPYRLILGVFFIFKQTDFNKNIFNRNLVRNTPLSNYLVCRVFCDREKSISATQYGKRFLMQSLSLSLHICLYACTNKYTYVYSYIRIYIIIHVCICEDRLCGLVVRVLGYRAGGLCLIPGTARKKKVVGLERGPLSLVSITEELLDRKAAAPV
jgi:hypothetical protein